MTIVTRLSIVLALVACGSTQETGDTTPEPVDVAEVEAPRPLDPLSVLPRATISVVTVDIARLRTSPYYPTVHGWLDLLPDMTPERRQALETVITTTDRAMFAMVSRGDRSAELGAIYFEGRFAEGQIGDLLRTIAAPPQAERFQEVQIGDYSGVGDDDAAVLQLEDGKYIMGPHQYIRESLQSPQRPASLSDANVAALEQALGATPAAIRGWVQLDASAQRLLARESDLPAELVEQLLAGAFVVDFADGATAEALGQTTSPQVAAQLAEVLQAEVDRYTTGLPARAAGLHLLNEGMTVAPDAERVRLNFAMSNEDTTALLSRLDNLFRLMLAAR